MKYELEVYTSAPELLQPGTSDLGVIAQTRSYPAELSRNLANLRYYTLLDHLSLDEPSEHPPRVIAGPIDSNQYYSIVHSVFAGPDHTGRTTPLVQSMAFRISEMMEQGVSAATAIANAKPALTAGWQGPPRWLEPPPEISNQRLDSATWPRAQVWGRIVARERNEELVSAIADSLINFKQTSRPVILLLSEEDAKDTLLILSDVLALLPPSVQTRTICISHVLDNSDFFRGAAFGLTYRQSAFYQNVSERHDPRRPIVIDPQSPSTFTIEKDQAYAQFLLAHLKQSAALPLSGLLNDWDACGFTTDSVDTFCRFVELLEKLSHTTTSEDVESANGMLFRLGQIPSKATQRIVDACLKSINAPNGEESLSKPQLMVSVLSASDWPEQVRRVAASRLTDVLDNALPAIFNQSRRDGDFLEINQILNDALRTTVQQHWPTIAMFALTNNSSPAVDLSTKLLDAPDIPASRIFKWTKAISRRREKNAEPIIRRLESRLATALTSPKASEIVQECMEKGSGASDVRLLVKTILKCPPMPKNDALHYVLQVCLNSKEPEGIVELIKSLHSSDALKPNSAILGQLLRHSSQSAHHETVQQTLAQIGAVVHRSDEDQVNIGEGVASRPTSLDQGHSQRRPFRRKPPNLRRSGIGYWLRRTTWPGGSWLAIVPLVGSIGTLAIAFIVKYSIRGDLRPRILSSFGLLTVLIVAGVVAWQMHQYFDRHPEKPPILNFCIQNSILIVILLVLALSVMTLANGHLPALPYFSIPNFSQ